MPKPCPNSIPPIRVVSTGWQDMILKGRKCSRKSGGGFGEQGPDPLRQAPRAMLTQTGRRGEAGLIETACRGVCPKRAVTLARASCPESLKIVPAGATAACLKERLS